jgi:hypothetical protein
MKYSHRNDYYLGRVGDEHFIISTSAGKDLDDGVDYDELEPITVRQALELDMTYARGWPTKTRKAINAEKLARLPKQNHDVLNMLLAYNVRLLSKAIGNFLLGK